MERRLSWIAIAVLSALLSIQITGCSALGLMMGTASDERTPRHQQILASEVIEIEPGHG